MGWGGDGVDGSGNDAPNRLFMKGVALSNSFFFFSCFRQIDSV